MRAAKLAPLLIVEDNADDLFLFTRLLKKAGVANPLYVASDGEEAVTLLERVVRNDELLQAPFMAFVDIKMPRMDGFELLAWIRKQRALDQLPVVILSSSSEARDVAQAAKIGAQFFFAKYPSDATIGRVLEAASRFAVNGANRKAHHVPSNLLPEPGGKA
jgi:CheY-like chemotaxis protein